MRARSILCWKVCKFLPGIETASSIYGTAKRVPISSAESLGNCIQGALKLEGGLNMKRRHPAQDSVVYPANRVVILYWPNALLGKLVLFSTFSILAAFGDHDANFRCANFIDIQHKREESFCFTLITPAALAWIQVDSDTWREGFGE